MEKFDKDFQFAVWHTTVKDGQMNSAAAFYPEGMDASRRGEIMRENKKKVADMVGFPIKRLFMSLQGKERGTSYTLTRDDVLKYEDLYDYDVYADTIKMRPDTAEFGTAIGFNISGAANVIAMNLKTMEATSTFCAGAHINEKVPERIIDILGGDPEDIYVDISPFDWIEPYYNPNDKDFRPAWMSNEEVWEGHYRRTDEGILLVDLYTPLMEQLVNSGIPLSHISNYGDVLTNPNFYSTQASRLQDINPYIAMYGNTIKNIPSDGRYQHGVAYVNDDKTYTQDNVKTYKRRK